MDMRVLEMVPMAVLEQLICFLRCETQIPGEHSHAVRVVARLGRDDEKTTRFLEARLLRPRSKGMFEISRQDDLKAGINKDLFQELPSGDITAHFRQSLLQLIVGKLRRPVFRHGVVIGVRVLANLPELDIPSGFQMPSTSSLANVLGDRFLGNAGWKTGGRAAYFKACFARFGMSLMEWQIFRIWMKSKWF